jgi:hypothetical protein
LSIALKGAVLKSVVKLVARVFVLSTILAGVAVNAEAISQITNVMSAEPIEFAPETTVNFETSTSYSSVTPLDPNPYTSNYQVNIRSRTFERPTYTSTNMSPANQPWNSVTLDPEIGGASWRVQWGTWLIWPTQNVYYNLRAVSKHWPHTDSDTGPSSHGNYDCGDTNFNSCGAPAKVNTVLHPRCDAESDPGACDDWII